MADPRFFVGLHQPSDAARFPAVFISVNRLKKRKSGFIVGDWIMDSGAFSTIMIHGGYPDPPEVYAAEIRRWAGNGNLLAAVAQDYMCEAHMLEKTGLTVEQHQQFTIERYDALTACDTGGVYIMPVLQGYSPEDYVRHIRMYGDRLQPGMWVGVGSVCKRNGDPIAIENVLIAIKRKRPDLLLHGFGLKMTALQSAVVRDLLFTADSMSWSFSAAAQAGILIRELGRELGRRVKPKEARAILAERGIVLRNANDWREAMAYVEQIETMPIQHSLLAAALVPGLSGGRDGLEGDHAA